MKAVYPAIDHQLERRFTASQQRIRVAKLDPLVRELRLRVKDVKRFVDSEDQRNPAQHVERERASLAGLVLVVGGGRRPPKQSALLVDAEIPGRADVQKSAHRGRGEPSAHLRVMALDGRVIQTAVECLVQRHRYLSLWITYSIYGDSCNHTTFFPGRYRVRLRDRNRGAGLARDVAA